MADRPPPCSAASGDPDRLVPIVGDPDDFMVAVRGDPLRTNAYAFAHNGMLGFPTTKPIPPSARLERPPGRGPGRVGHLAPA